MASLQSQIISISLKVCNNQSVSPHLAFSGSTNAHITRFEPWEGTPVINNNFEEVPGFYPGIQGFTSFTSGPLADSGEAYFSTNGIGSNGGMFSWDGVAGFISLCVTDGPSSTIRALSTTTRIYTQADANSEADYGRVMQLAW